MNDDRYLRSTKNLEKVGSKWWPKEGREEPMNGLGLYKTIPTNLTLRPEVSGIHRYKVKPFLDTIQIF